MWLLASDLRRWEVSYRLVGRREVFEPRLEEILWGLLAGTMGGWQRLD